MIQFRQLIIISFFSEQNGIKNIEDEIESILQNNTIPQKLRFMLRTNDAHSGNSHFVSFFWHIPKTGDSIVQQVCNRGYELKPRSILRTKKEIEILYRRMSGLSATAEEFWEAEKECKEHAKRLNEASKFSVYTTSWTYKQIEGCIPIKAMILPEHKCLPTCFNYIQTPEIYASAKLFSKTDKKARVATVLREPVDRFISMFNYLKTATWEPSFNPTNLTINEYILSGEYKEVEWGGNWMVCKLAQCGKHNSANDLKLNIAKNVLRNILVGFTDNMKEFFERLETYWQIPLESREKAKELIPSMDIKEMQNRTMASVLSEEAVKILQNHLSYDIQLYQYAQRSLWNEQAQWMLDP